MVKTTIRWFAKPVKRPERVDRMGVAILALSKRLKLKPTNKKHSYQLI